MDIKLSDIIGKTVIISQALVNMGYRIMKNNYWGKPIGYGLIIAEIKDNTIDLSTFFTSHQGKTEQWSLSMIDINLIDGSDEEMYNKCAYYIAQAESAAGVGRISEKFHPLGKTFDFRT